MDVDGEQLYEVEEIVDHRTSGNSKEYRIRWKGYGREEDVWQKAQDVLAFAEDAVNAYELKLKRPPKRRRRARRT